MNESICVVSYQLFRPKRESQLQESYVVSNTAQFLLFRPKFPIGFVIMKKATCGYPIRTRVHEDIVCVTSKEGQAIWYHT